MPISNVDPQVSHVANGSVTVFVFGFKVFKAADLAVTLDGVAKTNGIDFNATLLDLGGSITWIGAPPSGTLIIRRQTTLDRLEPDYQEGGDFLAETVDKDFDRTIAILQELSYSLRRAIKVPVAEAVIDQLLPAQASRINTLLGFNGTGLLTLLAQSTLSPTIIPSAFVQTLLDEADAAAFRLAAGFTDAVTVGDMPIATGGGAYGRKAVGLEGQVWTASPLATGGIDWVTPNAPRSLMPNAFFQVDQLALNLTAVTDDSHVHDHYVVLTQTAGIQVSSQLLQENGMPANILLTQNQAVAQRMAVVGIIEAATVQALRGRTITFRPRVRCSVSQPIRCAIIESTGTADLPTSDVVNDWTSTDYTDGPARFFVNTNQYPVGNSAVTPNAGTWTDLPKVTVTVGNSTNNLMLVVWTEGTAAQNVTLGIGKMRLVPGTFAPDVIAIPTFAETLQYAMRFFEKSFAYNVAPAQNAGQLGQELILQTVGASSAQTATIPFKVIKRIAPPTIIEYNPGAANSEFRNFSIGADCSGTTDTTGPTERQWRVNWTTAPGSAVGNINALHWTASARL